MPPILGPLQTRRRLQRQAFHEVLYNELLPSGGAVNQAPAARAKRDGPGALLRRRSNGSIRAARAPLAPLPPERAEIRHVQGHNLDSLQLYSSKDASEGLKLRPQDSARGSGGGLTPHRWGEHLEAARFAVEAQRSATCASLRAIQIRAAVSNGSLGASAPSSRPRTGDTCCSSPPLTSRNVSPVSPCLAQPEPCAKLETAPVQVLLNLVSWLLPSELVHFASSSPAVWRHREELGAWVLRQVYGMDVDDLRFLRRRGASHREEISALRALLFAWRQRRSQRRARRRGVAAGLQHSVVIKEGTALTWGAATSGQLGRGSPAERFHSVPTPVPLHVPVRMVACGGEHSLLVTVCGDVWAFGRNSDGQLGVGTDHDAVRPQLADVPRAAQVACGADHSLILTEDGSIWSCGRGTEGQLGIALSEFDRALSPICAVPEGACLVAAGADHSMYLDCYGRAFAFGENSKGQLGIGTSHSVSGPARVLLPPGTLAVDVECGGTHTLLLTDDLRVLGCGGNEKGQLGLGTRRDRHVPEPVLIHPNRPTFADRISCGFSHSVLLCQGAAWVLGGQAPKDLGEAQRSRFSAVPRRLRAAERLHISDVGAGGGHGLCVSGDAVFSFAVGADFADGPSGLVSPVVQAVPM